MFLNSKNQKSFALALLLTLSLNFTNFKTYALEDGEIEQIQKSVETYQQAQAQKVGSNLDLAKERKNKIAEMLMNSYQSFSDAEKEINQYEKELEPIQQNILTLKDQIANLDYQLEITQRKIKNINLLIQMREVDISDLMEKIEKGTVEMDAQTEMVKHYLQAIYQEEQQYQTGDENKDLINLLLADAQVSEIMQKEMYADVMEDTRKQIVYKLDSAKSEFLENQKKYEQVRKNLENLKTLLEEERRNVKLQQLAKEDLLAQTQGQETAYQRLIEESKKQQEESAFQIQNLQNNLALIQQKLALLEGQQTSLQSGSGKPLSNGSGAEAYTLNFVDSNQSETFFVWPVPPDGGITAYYLDSNYYERFKVLHEAIDIRQRQGSPIFAPANGYVYAVKDNGMGYSYIILAHRDGFMTVYGHVSEFMVAEGDLVHTGDIIGLTGGMPGTKGAGWMTTGPHLHFEVYKDGVHTNPLDYLLIEELPIEYIPAEYLDKIKLK